MNKENGVRPKEKIDIAGVSYINMQLGIPFNGISPRVQDLPRVINISPLWLHIQNNLAAYPEGQETFIGIDADHRGIVTTETTAGMLATVPEFRPNAFLGKREDAYSLIPSTYPLTSHLIQVHSHPAIEDNGYTLDRDQFLQSIPKNFYDDVTEGMLLHPRAYIAGTIDRKGPYHGAIFLVRTGETPKTFPEKRQKVLMRKMVEGLLTRWRDEIEHPSYLDDIISTYGIGVYRGFIERLPSPYDNSLHKQFLRKRNKSEDG